VGVNPRLCLCLLVSVETVSSLTDIHNTFMTLFEVSVAVQAAASIHEYIHRVAIPLVLLCSCTDYRIVTDSYVIVK